MNSRRLVKLLQAVSYDLPEYGQTGRNIHTEQLCENRISIQEAIQIYLQTAVQMVTPQLEQPGNNHAGCDKTDSEGEIDRYMAVVKVSQLENQRRRDAKERIQIRNQDKKHRGRAGATAQSLPCDAGQQQENALDRLDVNRTEGYLLYSYDQTGAHSILGRDIRPGSYGGRITMGNYAQKA